MQKLFALTEIHIHEIDIERDHSAGIEKNFQKSANPGHSENITISKGKETKGMRK